MTTIAFKDGFVASDSRLTQGAAALPEVMPKVWFSKTHPAIYAGCGDCSAFWGAAQMLDLQKKLPWKKKVWRPDHDLNLGKHSTLMVVEVDGSVHYMEGKFWFPVVASFYAMGSGAVAARAAMLAGASAEQAVEIACQLDTGSGLPVNVLRVADIPAPKQKRRRRR